MAFFLRYEFLQAVLVGISAVPLAVGAYSLKEKVSVAAIPLLHLVGLIVVYIALSSGKFALESRAQTIGGSVSLVALVAAISFSLFNAYRFSEARLNILVFQVGASIVLGIGAWLVAGVTATM